MTFAELAESSHNLPMAAAHVLADAVAKVLCDDKDSLLGMNHRSG